MKIRRLKLLMLLPILVLGIAACDDNDEKDPQKTILGKWEMIKRGDIEVIPKYHEEYLPDGTICRYYYESKEYEIQPYMYKIDSEKKILHHYYVENGEEIIAFSYSYEFYDDKLHLGWLYVTPQFSSFIYKRIK
ncbi:hypothetical protein D0T50_05245 [Bacteroides sp. 214]|uniref:hypothetical protein n=1 Tax=Bacteroides sp. 214 TaxID=2302935 RepID=UPI0013CF5163|nr:hypothetical protein [Bacteroides sp. 214]NDW12294.1 hypothetical protein [Bacteroides sp. 214]